MATTVKKGAKINFYKFVSVEKPQSSGANKGANKTNVQLTVALNKNVSALNNLGATLNSIAKVLTEFSATQQQLAQSFSAAAKPKFKPQYNKADSTGRGMDLSEGEVAETQMPGFLEAIFNIVKDFLVLAIAKPALEWLSKEENREKVKKVVSAIVEIFKAVSGFITDRVTGLIDNLYNLFSDETPWWEKIGDFFGAVVNFAGLFVAIRWLTNPLNIIKDFKSVMGGFVNALKGSKKSLLKKAGALGLLAAGGIAAYQYFAGGGNDSGESSGGSSSGTDAEYDDILMSKPKRASGGFINGPQSGYPVSLDGGRSVSFIGHGLEYVAQRSNGGFVVPLDTPSTKTNPGLTSSRMNEASRLGFDLGGLLQGFAGGGQVKPTNNTNTERSSTKGNNKSEVGGGQSAVVALGRAALRAGFTVAEHPNFKRNTHRGSGPNTGVGYNPRGGERVGGHSAGSAHYKGLAIDITDWRPGDWQGRTRALAEKIYKNRKKLKLTQIIHDPWGSWFSGESSKGGAYGGHPTHLHLAFANAMVKGGGQSTALRGPSGGGGGGSWKPLLDLIRKKEAGGSYEAMYPSTKLPGATKMTIKQVHDSPKRKGAVGGYQFLNPLGQAQAAGLKPTDKFSPENQDKMAIALITKKRKVTLDMVKKNPDEAMIRLGMEWAALPMPKKMKGHRRMVEAGQSYYAGDGRNKSHITVAEMKKVLGVVAGGGGGSVSIAGLDVDGVGEGIGDSDSDSGSMDSIDSVDSMPEIPTDPNLALASLVDQFKTIFGAESPASNLAPNTNTNNINAASSGSTQTLVNGTKTTLEAKQQNRTMVMQSVQQVQQLAAISTAQTEAVAQQGAKQQIQAQNAANSQKPTVVTAGGGSSSPNLIQQLNSANNPLKR